MVNEDVESRSFLKIVTRLIDNGCAGAHLFYSGVTLNPSSKLLHSTSPNSSDTNKQKFSESLYLDSVSEHESVRIVAMFILVRIPDGFDFSG